MTPSVKTAAWPVYAAAAVAIISVAAYVLTLANGFVYDDHSQVVQNAWIRDFSHIPEILVSSGRSFLGEKANTYRPMLHLVFMAEYHIFGVKAWGFHLVNVLFHAANGVLVTWLALFFLKGPAEDGNGSGRHGHARSAGIEAPGGFREALPAFFAGALFAVHPVNSEVVSWVSAVPELTFTFFLLISFLLYLKSAEPGGRVAKPGLFSASLAAFLLSLFGKETAMSLLVMIPVYAFASRGFSFIRGWKSIVPYYAVAAFYMAVRTSAVGGVVHHKQIELTGAEALLNAFPLVLGYFSKLLVPVNLNALYELHLADSFTEPRVLGGILIVALFLAAVALSRRRRTVFFGLFLTATPLLPVLYIPALSSAPFADRYMYLPTVGLALLAASILNGVLIGRYSKPAVVRVSVLIAALILAVFFAGSVKRSLVWKDDYTLWGDTVKKSPSNTNVHYNYAWACHKRGDLKTAAEHYREAIRLEPGSADAHYNLGMIYLTWDMPAQAADSFSSALAADPGYNQARERLLELGRLNRFRGM